MKSITKSVFQGIGVAAVSMAFFEGWSADWWWFLIGANLILSTLTTKTDE